MKNVNSKIEKLLLEISISSSSTWREDSRKEELKNLFLGLKLKLPINCSIFVSKYKKDGISGYLSRHGLISKIELNGKLEIEMICNSGFPDEFLEKISTEIKDITQLELEENH